MTSTRTEAHASIFTHRPDINGGFLVLPYLTYARIYASGETLPTISPSS